MKEINHIRKIADQKMISPTLSVGYQQAFKRRKKKWTTGKVQSDNKCNKRNKESINSAK